MPLVAGLCAPAHPPHQLLRSSVDSNFSKRNAVGPLSDVVFSACLARPFSELVQQCEALCEYAMAEQIRQILVEEQDHQIDLATALGEGVPNVGGAGSE